MVLANSNTNFERNHVYSRMMKFCFDMESPIHVCHHVFKLNKLKENANPDEFNFKMIKSRTIGGVNRPKSVANKYRQEELTLKKTQNIGYISLKFQAEKKKIDKLNSMLHSMGNPLSSKHVCYAEDRKMASSYRELEARQRRVKQLERIYMDMTMQKELQKKGRKRKLREDVVVCPTSTPFYRWLPGRKK